MNVTALIAKAIDKATVFDDQGFMIWLNATPYFDPDGPDGDAVVVTADPDFGETVRLAVRRLP